jgi:hypothetical protein
MWSEKNLFLVSDGGSTSRSVSTLLSGTFVCEQFVNTNRNTWNVKMRRIWWRSVCTGRFQQNLLNTFRYPNIQLVVCLIFRMDVNNLRDKLTDCSDFSLLQNLCPNLDISTLEYPTETSFYNSYYIPELPNLTSLPSQCYHHSYSHTVCAVRQCTTVDILWASVQTEKSKELGVIYFP